MGIKDFIEYLQDLPPDTIIVLDTGKEIGSDDLSLKNIDGDEYTYGRDTEEAWLEISTK